MVKDKKTKPSKELPLGFVDRQEKELLIRDFVISNIKEVMIKYGFQYLETPSFEYTDSIGKFLPDKDRPDQGVFSFKDEKNGFHFDTILRLLYQGMLQKTILNFLNPLNAIN
jgi:histidyl-tRNA synthetase